MMADSIYTKLLHIRKELSFVKVRKQGVSYPVLDGDTVLEMVGNSLAKHGIVFIPSMIEAKIMYVEIKGKMVQHALATFELIFMDTETGETFTVMTNGSGQSYDGKALGIAQTYGIKYFFYRMFLKGESDIDDEAAQPHPATSQQSAPEPRQQYYPEDGKGDEDDGRDDRTEQDNADSDTLHTISTVWPNVESKALLAMGVKHLPMPVGGVIYPNAKRVLGYASDDAVKTALGLGSLTEFAGTLEALMVCVIDKSEANES